MFHAFKIIKGDQKKRTKYYLDEESEYDAIWPPIFTKIMKTLLYFWSSNNNDVYIMNKANYPNGQVERRQSSGTGNS